MADDARLQALLEEVSQLPVVDKARLIALLVEQVRWGRLGEAEQKAFTDGLDALDRAQLRELAEGQWLENLPNGSTAFCFTLPVAKSDPSA